MASLNRPQMGFQKSAQNLVKKSASQAAQSAKAVAQTQAFEFAKSAKQQSGVPIGEVIVNPAEQAQSQEQFQSVPDGGAAGLNAQEVKRREQVLLNQWRNRLHEIQQEQAQAAQKSQEQYQVWKQTQEQQMQGANETESGASGSESGPKKGILKGMKAAIQQKVSKHETGRSAKH